MPPSMTVSHAEVGTRLSLERPARRARLPTTLVSASCQPQDHMLKMPLGNLGVGDLKVERVTMRPAAYWCCSILWLPNAVPHTHFPKQKSSPQTAKTTYGIARHGQGPG